MFFTACVFDLLGWLLHFKLIQLPTGWSQLIVETQIVVISTSRSIDSAYQNFGLIIRLCATCSETWPKRGSIPASVRPKDREGTRAYRSGQRLRFVTSRSRVRIGVAASFFVEAGGSSDSADSEHDGLEWFGNVELDSGCVGHDNRPSGRISARLGLHGPMPV